MIVLCALLNRAAGGYHHLQKTLAINMHKVNAAYV